ncbi:Crp/Fnr family transcriptional regulator [Desulfohalobium retbaense]|uniref:Transcriptional regulator, Crp/Fnr family n=1 Tax=Desulfohalobium retbaense (strain ATCC 49708 / DSM 5692 / JCM 16813 / HR100) TaxID=485915 RepID=C8X0Y2_DESRD|nr:cyclic nucleotide-binding domain-containing protein [Desulfohalobium retbaense]ACV68079.1 putative transcriptional regulator, Crp/Fnr family [Desulfohalobium retbaense DSM 5692]
MVTISELKKMKALDALNDDQLQILLPYISQFECQAREIIYQRGHQAHNFYMLKSGKAYLEMQVTKDIEISLTSIKPGYSFGWHALISEGTHSYTAVSDEPSTILTIARNDLQAIIEAHQDIGFRLMQRMCEILYHRLDHRTAQFLSILTKHPDMKELLEDAVMQCVLPQF